jgi:hypothetical protein
LEKNVVLVEFLHVAIYFFPRVSGLRVYGCDAYVVDYQAKSHGKWPPDRGREPWLTMKRKICQDLTSRP